MHDDKLVTVHIKMDEESLKLLDIQAKANGYHVRSAYIRKVLQDELNKKPKK